MVRIIPGITVALSLFASPALAQNAEPAHDAAPQALRQLQDPHMADSVAAIVEGLARSLMAMPVGPLADAVRRVDPNSEFANVDRNATLGDVAHMNSSDASRLGDNAHAAGTMVAGMSRQLEVMLPVLESMARDMSTQWGAQWDQARRNSRNRR